MIYLIAGCSYAGKTILAQRMMERLSIPYLSIDHMKMGLIRCGIIHCNVEDDETIIKEVWPIIREMMHTVLENHQNMIIEGCYIPSSWKDAFDEEACKQIKYICLIFHENYIKEHIQSIYAYENVIEQRLTCERLEAKSLIEEHREQLEQCKQYELPYLMIKQNYESEINEWLDQQVIV